MFSKKLNKLIKSVFSKVWNKLSAWDDVDRNREPGGNSKKEI
jgi:hypothetical protein